MRRYFQYLQPVYGDLLYVEAEEGLLCCVVHRTVHEEIYRTKPRKSYSTSCLEQFVALGALVEITAMQAMMLEAFKNES